MRKMGRTRAGEWSRYPAPRGCDFVGARAGYWVFFSPWLVVYRLALHRKSALASRFMTDKSSIRDDKAAREFGL